MSCRPGSTYFLPGQTSQQATCRSESPGGDRECSDDKCDDNMPCCISVYRVGYRGSCHIEEDAGISPFLEPWEAGQEQGYRSKHFPKSDDRNEVRWIAKQYHPVNGLLSLHQFRHTTTQNRRHHDCDGHPIARGLCFSSVRPPGFRSECDCHFITMRESMRSPGAGCCFSIL